MILTDTAAPRCLAYGVSDKPTTDLPSVLICCRDGLRITFKLADVARRTRNVRIRRDLRRPMLPRLDPSLTRRSRRAVRGVCGPGVPCPPAHPSR
jgi:hypothetical protein